jgi:hypothetical protein
MDLWKGVTDTVERYVPGAKLQVAKIADKAKVRRCCALRAVFLRALLFAALAL